MIEIQSKANVIQFIKHKSHSQKKWHWVLMYKDVKYVHALSTRGYVFHTAAYVFHSWNAPLFTSVLFGQMVSPSSDWGAHTYIIPITNASKSILGNVGFLKMFLLPRRNTNKYVYKFLLKILGRYIAHREKKKLATTSSEPLRGTLKSSVLTPTQLLSFLRNWLNTLGRQ